MATSFENFKIWYKYKRRAGLVLFWGGLIMVFVDMFSHIPTPVRGAFVFAFWVPMIIVGAVSYVLSTKLPIEETMALAKEHNNELTVTDVISELGITLSVAEKTLEVLRKRGYVKAQKRGNLIIWVFGFN